MQLRRLWPVQPLAPCGQHRLGSQCESWQLVKSDELSHHNESPFFSSLFFSCLPSRRRLPPHRNNRIKNRSLFTEKWSNHPLRLASRWARRSSRSRRRWGNACRRSTAAPCQSRFALTLHWSAHKRLRQTIFEVFVEIPDNIQHYWHCLFWKRPIETKRHLSFVENGADSSETLNNKSTHYAFNPQNSLQRALVKKNVLRTFRGGFTVWATYSVHRLWVGGNICVSYRINTEHWNTHRLEFFSVLLSLGPVCRV